MLFSKRNNLIPLSKELQIDSIDEELRIRLWNLLTIFCWNRFRGYAGYDNIDKSNFDNFIFYCWHDYFKLPVDNIPTFFREALEIIREKFFSFSWYQVYDFLEFTFEHIPKDLQYIENLPKACNKVLEEENSAYRVVDDHFIKITDDIEIEEVEKTISIAEKFIGVKTHFKTALDLLSDRKNPDYRNSIKESISAVESLCQIITKNKKATLGEALKLLDEDLKIHSALKIAFSKLYGYTSDKDGIRHSILEEPDITFSDAKYMLVTCSAFVNFLIGKVAEKNIQI